MYNSKCYIASLIHYLSFLLVNLAQAVERINIKQNITNISQFQETADLYKKVNYTFATEETTYFDNTSFPQFIANKTQAVPLFLETKYTNKPFNFLFTDLINSSFYQKQLYTSKQLTNLVRIYYGNIFNSLWLLCKDEKHIFNISQNEIIKTVQLPSIEEKQSFKGMAKRSNFIGRFSWYVRNNT